MPTSRIIKSLLPPSKGMYSLMFLTAGLSLVSLLTFGMILFPLATSQAQTQPSPTLCRGLQAICQQQLKLNDQSLFKNSSQMAEPAICTYVKTTCGLPVSSTASSSSISSSSAPSDGCYCTMQYSPVCAAGKTFGNECQARCEGHTTWTPGECS